MALLLDSMLIVEQLRGRWRVKDAKLGPAPRRGDGAPGPACAAGARATSRAARTARPTPWPTRPWTGSRPAGPAVVVRRPGEGIRSEAAARLADAAPDAGDAAPGAAPADAAGRRARPAARWGWSRASTRAIPARRPASCASGSWARGTSQGLPRIACDCATCTSTDPRDRRLRASALLAWGARRVVIDCGPDFRAQALAADLDRLDAVLLTHEHQDAIGGLDDLRRFNEIAGDYLPVHGLPETLEVVLRRFAYAFAPGQARFGGIPMLRPVAIAGSVRDRRPPLRARAGRPRRAPGGRLPDRRVRRTSPTSSGSRRRRWRSCATSTSWSSTPCATCRTRPTRPSPRPWRSSRSCGRGGPS